MKEGKFMPQRSRSFRIGWVGLVAFALISLITPNVAQGISPQPLPPLPSHDAIGSVIKTSGGPIYTSLGVPSSILNGFGAFQSPLAIQSNIDTQRIAAYITTGTNLTQIAMPLIGAATTALQPTIQTPDDGTPATIIGGLYQSTNGDTVIVATFNGSAKKVKELRFYQITGGTLGYTSIKYKGRKLQGVGGQPSQGDAGAVIANGEVCYAIGLDQVCFTPDSSLRDGSVNGAIQGAYNALANTYNLGVSFDLNNAVPDLIGHNFRSQCASANLSGSACTPNIIHTAALNPSSGQPIAIFHVTGFNDLWAFDINGNVLAGGVPLGDYVVLNATPNQPPGAVGVLFLVNAASGQPNYLIPARAVEGFGSGDGNSGQAGIKDGMAGGWGW